MLQDCLEKNFGLSCRVEKTKISGLPIYMTASREIYRAEIGGISFLLVKPTDNESFGAVALKKQLSAFEENVGLNVAFWLDNINRAQRDALISKGIPFVAMPSQAFLPFLGIVLSNTFKTGIQVLGDRMMPATQCLFLYMLYNRTGEYVIKKQAAEALGLTKTSISRASEQLKKMGLISEKKCGREIRMFPAAKGFELYKMARKHLINPVQNEMYVNGASHEGLIIAGETSLSRHSMLAEPKEIDFAVFKGAECVDGFVQIDPRWQDGGKIYRIEMWKYNPALFASDGEVDPVSLAMSLSEEPDERVQGELEAYLEGYKW